MPLRLPLQFLHQRMAHLCTWDNLGILASSLCVIHCLLVSLLLLVFPLGMERIEDETHFVLFFLVVPIAAYSLLRGYFHHKDFSILCAGILGVILITISLGSHGHHFSENWEHGLATLGSFFLIWAHFKNIKACPKGCAVGSPPGH